MPSVYKPLKRYFYATFFTLALSLVQYSTDNAVFLLLTNIIFIVFYIVQIQALFAMRPISKRFKSAFRFFIMSLVGIILSIIVIGFSIYSKNIYLATVSLLAMVVFAVFSIVANYQFAWGLDDLVTERNYNYPKGKIKLIFWLSIISSLFVSSIIQAGAFIPALVIGTACSIYTLWLLYSYLQEVEKAESQI